MKEESVPPTNFKSRTCQFVLYPESQQVNIEYCQTHLQCAWALHDKDTYSEKDFNKYVKANGKEPEWKAGDLKKPHVHFVCNFTNPRYFSGVAKAVGISIHAIQRVDNLYKAYVYLWHKNEGDDKFHYPEDIVEMNNFQVPSEHYGVSQADAEQVEALLNMPDFGSIYEMSRWAYENNCWASYRKNYSMWRDIWAARHRVLVNEALNRQACEEFHKYNDVPGDMPDPYGN